MELNWNLESLIAGENNDYRYSTEKLDDMFDFLQALVLPDAINFHKNISLFLCKKGGN